jgi:hypothetical protein
MTSAGRTGPPRRTTPNISEFTVAPAWATTTESTTQPSDRVTVPKHRRRVPKTKPSACHTRRERHLALHFAGPVPVWAVAPSTTIGPNAEESTLSMFA